MPELHRHQCGFFQGEYAPETLIGRHSVAAAWKHMRHIWLCGYLITENGKPIPKIAFNYLTANAKVANATDSSRLVAMAAGVWIWFLSRSD